jgi:hypothetical protein
MAKAPCDSGTAVLDGRSIDGSTEGKRRRSLALGNSCGQGMLIGAAEYLPGPQRK